MFCIKSHICWPKKPLCVCMSSVNRIYHITVKSHSQGNAENNVKHGKVDSFYSTVYESLMDHSAELLFGMDSGLKILKSSQKQTPEGY